MKITRLTEYTQEVAKRIRELLIQLSRSHSDPGEIPADYINEIIASPYHDIFIAELDDGMIAGVAVMSVLTNLKQKKAYLEDFVTDASVRGQGVGSKMWDYMLDWAREKGCTELDFTSGKGREEAWKFYQNKGAEIYETNFFKKAL